MHTNIPIYVYNCHILNITTAENIIFTDRVVTEEMEFYLRRIEGRTRSKLANPYIYIYIYIYNP